MTGFFALSVFVQSAVQILLTLIVLAEIYCLITCLIYKTEKADIFAEEGSLFVKLNLDGGVPVSLNEKLRNRLDVFGGKMNTTEEDGTLFVSLFIPKGGEGR